MNRPDKVFEGKPCRVCSGTTRYITPRKDGYKPCVACSIRKRRVYYLKNREKVIAQVKQRYYELRGDPVKVQKFNKRKELAYRIGTAVLRMVAANEEQVDA